MSTIIMTGKIALAVIIGVSVMATINSIKINSLDPQGDKIEDVTESIGGQTVQISSADQFKALTTYNMFAAVDCRVLLWVDQLQQDGNNVNSMSALNNGGVNHTAFFGHGFNPLFEETEFTGTCAGSSSAIYEGREALEEAEGQIASRGVDAIASGFQFAATVSGNPIAAAGADAAGDALKNAVYQTITSEGVWEQPSQDMEGTYGRTTFNVSNDNGFLLGGSDGRNRLIATKIVESGGIWSLGNGGNKIPPYFHGYRASYFLPSGYEAQYNEEDFNNEYKRRLTALLSYEYNNYQDMFNILGDQTFPNQGKAVLYAFRPRIETDTRRLIVNDQERIWNRNSGADGLRQILENGRWKFCEGDKGYIQSNAGSITNNAEATGQDAWREDTVFPKIVLTNEADCIDKRGPQDIQTGFAGYKIRTNTCSAEEALNNEFKTTMSIADTEVDYHCGLHNQFMLSQKAYGQHTRYLATGLYADQSGDTCETIDEMYILSDSIETTQFAEVLSTTDASEIVNVNVDRRDVDVNLDEIGNFRNGNNTVELRNVGQSETHSGDYYHVKGANEEDYVYAQWGLKEYDDFTFKTKIDIRSDGRGFRGGQSNGYVDLRLNGKKVATFDKKAGSSELLSQLSSDSTIINNRVHNDGETDDGNGEISGDENYLTIEVDETGTGSITYHYPDETNPSIPDQSIEFEYKNGNNDRNRDFGSIRNIRIDIRGKAGYNHQMAVGLEEPRLETFKPAGCGE